MKHSKPLQKKRWSIITAFVSLGFRGQTAFFNVCKTLDATLNGLELVAFWSAGVTNELLQNRLEEILETLKNE